MMIEHIRRESLLAYESGDNSFKKIFNLKPKVYVDFV